MEPTRINPDLDPVEQPDVHCKVDELVKRGLHRMLAQPADVEAFMQEMIGLVGPLLSPTDPKEHNYVRMAMYARHLADHIFERIGLVLDDSITRILKERFDFSVDQQQRYGHAVLLADGTIGEEIDLGGGLVAYLGEPEDGGYADPN